MLKQLVDSVSQPQILVLPVALLVGYGLLRLATTTFTELREFFFAKVTQRAVRTIALEVFGHLHALSLRFHLARQTGGLTRDIERGTRGISTLIGYTLFSILPTLVEIALVSAVLIARYDVWFIGITVVALALYIVYTIAVTEWRTGFRRSMNELDSKANTRAIDSLLNYETVKYFGNEEYEARRYDESMQRWETAAVKSQTSLSTLNIGQSAIIAIAVTLIMWRATLGVVNRTMTIGDLVLVNAFMIQLYIPLNFLGVIYREIKQAVADMERMFHLIGEHAEIQDPPDAPPLALTRGEVRFEHVDFFYEPTRQILFDVSLRDSRGPHGRGGRSQRLGQVDAGATAVSLLRRERRAHHHRRPGHARGAAVIGPRGDRHRSAGHGALQRLHRIQHRLRPAGCTPRRDRRGGAARADPRFHRDAAGRLCNAGGRARSEAFGWREAARGHRPGDSQAAADPGFRRSDLGPRFQVRKGDPGSNWSESPGITPP